MMYQIVHSFWGRCRIRIPRLAIDDKFAENLSGLVESLGFVTEVRINPSASSLIVNYKTTTVSLENAEKDIISCILKAKTANLQLIVTSPESQVQELAEESDSIPNVNKWEDVSLPVLSLSLAILATPLELPAVLVGAAIAGAAMPWLQRATDSIINHRHPNIDLLDYTWMALQTVRGQYIAPALKTTLVEVRRTLRGTVTEKRVQETAQLLNYLNQVECGELREGSQIIVNSGEKIPVDGKIISGNGWVNCSQLQGIDTRIFCTPGQEVYASSVVEKGELSILVKRTGIHTRIGLIANLMQSAPVHDTQIGAEQAQLVKLAILPTLAFGGIVFALTGNLGAAISPYQLDFGSGIPITTSTTMLQALIQATRNGVYIRSGRILETLAKVDTLVVDHSTLRKLEGESIKVMEILQKQGITIYLQTQNHIKETITLAEKWGIDQDYTLIEGELIDQLHTQGRIVAVLGDIGNSRKTPNSLSIALGDDIANQAADMLLLDNNLWGLVDAIAIAKRTMQAIYQNTAIIVIPNLIMQIGAGMILGVSPIWNVIINNSSAFIAEFLNNDLQMSYRIYMRY